MLVGTREIIKVEDLYQFIEEKKNCPYWSEAIKKWERECLKNEWDKIKDEFWYHIDSDFIELSAICSFTPKKDKWLVFYNESDDKIYIMEIIEDVVE